MARLEPMTTGPRADDEGRLARLVRDGIVRTARGTFPKALLASAPPRPKTGVSGVGALIADRRAGR